MESSSKSAEGRVCLGHVVGAQGLAGWLTVRPIGSHPERFNQLEQADLDGVIFQVEKVRISERGVLLKLAGVDDRDRAETLRGNSIWVEHWQRISLPKGEYFVDDLIGFQVVTDTGEAVGSLEAVWNMPANDVFLVRTVEGLQILIPATRNIVRAIEVEKRLMVVESWGVSQ